MGMRAKLVTEFAGTFVFLSVIALSGRAGALAPLAIGLALTAMVYMGGHISGAHYNPAVSFGLFLRRVISLPVMVQYWLCQLAAGVLAFALAFLVTGQSSGIHPGANVYWSSALAAEILMTGALVLVVLNVAATRETAGNSYYGVAIGFTVAAFNPAVGFGATIGAALFTHGGWSDLWLYIVGPVIGAAVAAVIHSIQGRQNPVLPETSER
jgi:aquaporin Z